MNFNLTALIVDSADLESESAFWHHLLDGSLTKTPTHHFLHVDGLPFISSRTRPSTYPRSGPTGMRSRCTSTSPPTIQPLRTNVYSPRAAGVCVPPTIFPPPAHQARGYTPARPGTPSASGRPDRTHRRKLCGRGAAERSVSPELPLNAGPFGRPGR